MILTEKEIFGYLPPEEDNMAFARAIEAAVLEKLKAQEPLGAAGDLMDDYVLEQLEIRSSTLLYLYPLPPDDVVRDAERLDWLLKNTDATVCSDGAYGPFHIWFRYSNRTTEPANTAREAIDAAMEKIK